MNVQMQNHVKSKNTKGFAKIKSTVTCKWRTSANGIFFIWGVVKSWDGVCPKYAIWSCVAHCWTFGRKKIGIIYEYQTINIIRQITANCTYWVWDLININSPFISNVKENIIRQNSFSASLLIPEYSNLIL